MAGAVSGRRQEVERGPHAGVRGDPSRATRTATRALAAPAAETSPPERR